MLLGRVLLTFSLSVSAIILFLLGLGTEGWLSLPFIIAAWALIYFAEGSIRSRSANIWLGYLGAAIFCVGLFAMDLLLPQGKASPIPKADNLETSRGVLKRGLSRNIFIIKEDGSSLSLLCGDNAGRYMTQTCVNDIPRQAYGRTVVVRHTDEFKHVTATAFFYEMIVDGVAVVNYGHVMQSGLDRQRRINDAGDKQTIPLLSSIMCLTMCAWLRWRQRERTGALIPVDDRQ